MGARTQILGVSNAIFCILYTKRRFSKMQQKLRDIIPFKPKNEFMTH